MAGVLIASSLFGVFGAVGVVIAAVRRRRAQLAPRYIAQRGQAAVRPCDRRCRE